MPVRKKNNKLLNLLNKAEERKKKEDKELKELGIKHRKEKNELASLIYNDKKFQNEIKEIIETFKFKSKEKKLTNCFINKYKQEIEFMIHYPSGLGGVYKRKVAIAYYYLDSISVYWKIDDTNDLNDEIQKVFFKRGDKKKWSKEDIKKIRKKFIDEIYNMILYHFERSY